MLTTPTSLQASTSMNINWSPRLDKFTKCCETSQVFLGHFVCCCQSGKRHSKSSAVWFKLSLVNVRWLPHSVSHCWIESVTTQVAVAVDIVMTITVFSLYIYVLSLLVIWYHHKISTCKEWNNFFPHIIIVIAILIYQLGVKWKSGDRINKW